MQYRITYVAPLLDNAFQKNSILKHEKEITNNLNTNLNY